MSHYAGSSPDARRPHVVTSSATQLLHVVEHAVEAALRLPGPPPSRWHRAGVSRRTERVLDVVFGLVLITFAIGWSWSIAEARASEGPLDATTTDVTRTITTALTDPDAPSIAYLTDASLDLFVPLRGESGRLKAAVGEPGEPIVEDSLPAGASIAYSNAAGANGSSAERPVVHGILGRATSTAPSPVATPDTAAFLTSSDSSGVPLAPEASGVWRAAIQLGNTLKEVTDFSIITLTPLSRRHGGRIGLYYIGRWPTERGRARPGYAPPPGFIEVTEETRDTPVSDHFTLGDFLTHGQESVWPKYLVLDMQLVDKLELVLLDLEQRGYETNGVHVMSGFRTPAYNARGGNTAGRASLSRHMYGDAADIFIDNDGNGWMDDLNHDGRIDIRDSEVIRAAVDRVEREHPEMVGGAGVYSAASGHGPFIHIDARGYRARWTGTGDS
jgi:uncharacterized protein YcbK (DUF882 family)